MIEVRNITKVFEHKEVKVEALCDVSFVIGDGESVAISGSSGAGKSTLLGILGGLDRPSRGEVLIDGERLTTLDETAEARFRNEKVGFVFQFHHLLSDFSVLENVMMPLLIAQCSFKKAQETARTMLETVGLGLLTTRHPLELSGGEQQRAAIARALVHRPKYLFADEPTGNLDDQNSNQVFDLLCGLNRDLRATLIVVTHNQAFANRMNRKILLDQGRLMVDE